MGLRRRSIGVGALFAASLMTGLAASDLRAQAMTPASNPPAPAAALAVDTPPAVVVTPLQVAQPAFDSPASVDVVGATQIGAAQRQVNLSETLSRVPGLVVQD